MKNCSLLFCLLLGIAISAPLFATANLTLQAPASGLVTIPDSLNATFDPDSLDYSILSNSALAQPMQGYGTYVDFVGQNFIILNPIPTVESPYSLQLGQYQFNPGVPKNTEITGVTISLFYTLYSVDPNSSSFDPIADYVSNDEVSITNLTLEDEQADAGPPLTATPAVPEPNSWALTAAGLLVVVCSKLRKRVTVSD